MVYILGHPQTSNCNGTVNKSEGEDSSAAEGEYLLINENKTQKQKPTRGKTYFIKHKT